MYTNFFTSYLTTENPPVIPDDYVDNYTEVFYDPETGQLSNLSFWEKKTFEILPDELDLPFDIGTAAADIATSFLGTRYSWGGSSPSTGFDCSGLIQHSYDQVGIKLPRTAKEMEHVGEEVTLSDVRPGDIICTTGSGLSGRHVKMVSRITDGHPYTVEAKGKKEGIVEKPLVDIDNIITIRRPLSHLTFTDLADYARQMHAYLYLALQKQGLDAETWAPILTALTAVESAWGNSWSRKNNNFAGIKGKGSGQVKTKEWSPLKGYYTVTDSFKRYNTVSEFADDYVRLLKNRFHAFDGDPDDYLSNIRKRGYFTDSLSNYSRNFNSVLKRVNRALNNS